METLSLIVPKPSLFPPTTTKWTHHARHRASIRGIAADVVDLVLAYGRAVYARDAAIYAVGRKEVRSGRHLGVDLMRCQSVHVVCSSSSDTILTVYRNERFKGLRPGRRRPRTQLPTTKRGA